MTSHPPALIDRPATDTALTALERAWRRFADDRTLIRRGGRITEVSQTQYRVRGISDAARLGDIVEHRG